MSRMRAFILATGRTIPPFNDPVAEVLVNHRPLSEHQEAALSGAGFGCRRISGIEEIPSSDYPCLTLDDDLYFNSALIREFVGLSNRRSGSTRCVIPPDTIFAQVFSSLRERTPDGSVPFPIHYRRDSGRDEAEPVAVDLGEHLVPFYIPEHMRGGAETAMPLCLRPLVRIVHPLDLLYANVACLNIRFAETMASSGRRLGLALAARSRQPSRLLARMNRIGPGCDIHPTAYLEGAEIGAKVHIGANAVIRMSSVGDGCDIGDGSVVKHSIVGSGSVLFDDLTLGFAVCYPETFLIHGPYHLSVFGRSSAMFATILDDFRLDGKPIRLEVDGRFVPHPFPFIGSFIGHRTRVAGGSILSPGRIIPNDLLIFPSPRQMLSRIGANLPTGVPLFIEDGGLMTIEEIREREAASRDTGTLTR